MGECIGHVIREVTEQLIVTCMRGKIAKKVTKYYTKSRTEEKPKYLKNQDYSSKIDAWTFYYCALRNLSTSRQNTQHMLEVLKIKFISESVEKT